MMRKFSCALWLTGSLVGCSTDPVEAPYYAELSEFEDVKVSWESCDIDIQTGELTNPNCRPSNPVVLRLQAHVYNPATMVPLNNVRVRWSSGWGEVYLLPPEVLQQVEYPSGDQEGGTEWGEVADQNNEVWAEFSGRFAGDYRPVYHEGYTDDGGTSSVWAWVQSMPVDETGKAMETSISVAIAPMVRIINLQTSQ